MKTGPFIAIATALSLCSAAPVRAQSSPASNQALNVQGILRTNAGDLQSANVGLVVSLYPTPTGGTPFYTQNFATVGIENGFFSVELSGANLSFSVADAWVGILVNGDGAEMPRQHLTAVPYAFNAGVANTLSGVLPVANGGTGATGVEDWKPATLINKWAPYGPQDGWSTAAYYKDPFGIVHLKGLINGSAATNAVAFNLPAGYRPGENVVIPGHGYSSSLTLCSIYIYGKNIGANANVTLGDVYLSPGQGYGWVSLDGASFRAAQ
jgi:hypothetical protein